MSKVGDLVIANEELFFEIANEQLKEHDTVLGLEDYMYEHHQHLMKHMDWQDVCDQLYEGWNEYCQEYCIKRTWDLKNRTPKKFQTQ